MTLLVLSVSALCELFLLQFFYRLTREMQCQPPGELENNLCSDEGVESDSNFHDEIENQRSAKCTQNHGPNHLQHVVVYIPNLRSGVREFSPAGSARDYEENRGLDQAG